MQITLKLFGSLRQYLPPGSRFDGYEINLPPGTSVDELLNQVPIPPTKPYLVILNDDKIDELNFKTIQIRENDEVVLLPPIKGG